MRLRPWTDDDAPALVATYQDPDIQRWHSRVMTHEEAVTWIRTGQAGWADQVIASWAMDVDGRLAGRMTLRLNLDEGRAVAAYWTTPEHRGKGLAPAGLGSASDWAFSIGIHRIELEHSTRNNASCRVATKAGFAVEGTRVSALLHADGWHDMHLHARVVDT